MAAGAAYFKQRVTGDTERQPDQPLDRRRNVDFVPGRVSQRRGILRQHCRTSGADLGAVLAPGGDHQFLTATMTWTARLLAGPLPRPLLGRWPLAINRWSLFRLFRRAPSRLRGDVGSAALARRVTLFLRATCLRPGRLAGRRTRAVVRVLIQPILQLLHVVQQALRHFQQELPSAAFSATRRSSGTGHVCSGASCRIRQVVCKFRNYAIQIIRLAPFLKRV